MITERHETKFQWEQTNETTLRNYVNSLSKVLNFARACVLASNSRSRVITGRLSERPSYGLWTACWMDGRMISFVESSREECALYCHFRSLDMHAGDFLQTLAFIRRDLLERRSSCTCSARACVGLCLCLVTVQVARFPGEFVNYFDDNALFMYQNPSESCALAHLSEGSL